MLDNYWLVERDGWAFVLNECADYAKPMIRRFWWPIGLRWRDVAFRGFEKGEALTSGGSGGIYSLRDRSAPRIALENGGQTKATHYEEVALIPPKARTEVRWAYGRGFQKLLKTGWVDIGIGTPQKPLTATGDRPAPPVPELSSIT